MSSIEHQLNAISPIDGRYLQKTHSLKEYFSERALIKYRAFIEIEYLIHFLSFIGIHLTVDQTSRIQTILTQWGITDATEIKNIENTTKHDIKALEIHLRNKLDDIGLSNYKEHIHFGLTSQDINSTANILSIRDTNQHEIIPLVKQFIHILTDKSNLDKWNIPMLSKTHGQAASPTTLKKEMTVFIYRLHRQIESLQKHPYSTKFGGAVGNLNSHYAAYPDKDWNAFSEAFLQQFDLTRNTYTTQIDIYDNYSEIFDNLKRICVILLDFSRDMWLYISYNYFNQICIHDEIGSSTMPHKINPINFENAEGNLMIAIELLEFISKKLPVSRLQRDLTDSTVLRNVGTIYGHILISITSLLDGIQRVEPNTFVIDQDLRSNTIVLAEAIQSILRRENIANSYDIIKYLSRGNNTFDMNTVIIQLREKLTELQIEPARIEQIIQACNTLDVRTYIGNVSSKEIGEII